MQVITRVSELRDSFLERFAAAGLDALLCPGLGLPAFPHGMSVLLNQACSHTLVWNLFNVPAGTLPVTFVRADEQFYDGGKLQDSLSRAAHVAMRGSQGLPIGVQIVTQPWKDEACLGAMQVVEDAVGRLDPMPGGRLDLIARLH